jgi:Uma2 family endonuclease
VGFRANVIVDCRICDWIASPIVEQLRPFTARDRFLERSGAAGVSHGRCRMGGVKAAAPRVGYADMERWPEDGRRCELYDGEVFEVPSPIPLHQIVLGRLYLALDAYTHAHGGLALLAPLDIVLTEYDVVQPDLLMFTRERQHLLQLRKVTRVPPDVAIEILSPGTAPNDRGRKKDLLARHGVREYWLVDPDRVAIELFALVDGELRLVTIVIGDDRVVSPLLGELDLTPATVVRQDESLG